MSKNNNSNKNIEITIKTWKTDSEGIFLYKTDPSSYKIVKSTIKNNYYLIRRNNNNIVLKNYQSEFKDRDGEILFCIRKSFKDGSFELINPVRKKMIKNEKNIFNLNSRIWYVLKSKKEYNDIDNEDYNINENDIIKLGRRKFEVIKKNITSYNNNIKSFENKDNYNISEMNKRKGSIFDINLKPNQYKITENELKKEEKEEKEIKIKEKKQRIEKNNKNNDFKPILSNIQNNKETDMQSNKFDYYDNFYADNDENYCQTNDNEEIEGEKCRICFEIKSTKNNPKICLCMCKDYIHYECLKTYISTKLKIQENPRSTVKTYNCNKFNCDVCLSPYPLRFRIPEFNKIYELIDLTMPSELDYVILESLDYIKDHANLKTVHMVTLNGDDIHIGRYETNDIIDTDISVSRNHAIMTYNRDTGKLILENLSEKFGTLVLIKGNIKMKEKKIHLQAGKSYIVAKVGEENISIDNNKNHNRNTEENNDNDNDKDDFYS